MSTHSQAESASFSSSWLFWQVLIWQAMFGIGILLGVHFEHALKLLE